MTLGARSNPAPIFPMDNRQQGEIKMASEKREEVDVSKMIALEQELHELKKEQGIEEKEGKVSGQACPGTEPQRISKRRN